MINIEVRWSVWHNSYIFVQGWLFYNLLYGVGLATQPVRYSSYTVLCNFRATSLGLWVICYQISSHFLTGGLLVMLLMLLAGWVLLIIILAPLGCWFYLVESGGHQPQNLNWIKQMTGPHLPGCLDCWFMASGIHTWSVSCIDSNIRSGRARASVLDSEGSQILPEDLGPGEPVSGLRP